MKPTPTHVSVMAEITLRLEFKPDGDEQSIGAVRQALQALLESDTGVAVGTIHIIETMPAPPDDEGDEDNEAWKVS